MEVYAFDIAVPFTTPFLYDPSAGNLLLDFKNFALNEPLLAVSFDRDGTVGDSISVVRCFGDADLGTSCVDSPTAGPGTFAFPTQFTFVAAADIPEPASAGLFGFGLIGLLLVNFFRGGLTRQVGS